MIVKDLLDSNKPLTIGISQEHAAYAPEIEKCFTGLRVSINPTYARCSMQELPMQIIIFLGMSVASGAVYDLLKISIFNIFKKFKNARIRIHKNAEGLIFGIRSDGSVNVIVVPEREDEFVHIKNIDDLIKHLKEVNKKGRDEWKLTTLGEVAEIFDCPHSTPKWTSGGYFVVRNYNLSEGRISKENPSFTDENNYRERIKRATPEIGNIILSREAPIGAIGFVKDNQKICLGQRVVLIKPKKIFDKFLLFQMLSPLVQDEFKVAEASGSVVSNFRIPQIKALKLFLPDLPEQRAIAAVLSSFEDKIELLREQNKTLEATAHAIFKEWFVNFNFPGATGKMIDSELGEIPEGWRVGRFSDIVSILGGGTPKTDVPAYWGGNIPFFTPKDAEGVYCMRTEKTITSEGLQSCNSKLYPKNTVFITARGTVGKCALASANMAMNQSCYALCGKGISNFFIFLLTRHLVNSIQKVASGGVFDAITTSTFESMEIVIPQSFVAEKFSVITEPVFEKIWINSFQIQTLSKLRDTLLPKLMKGEVRVKGF